MSKLQEARESLSRAPSCIKNLEPRSGRAGNSPARPRILRRGEARNESMWFGKMGPKTPRSIGALVDDGAAGFVPRTLGSTSIGGGRAGDGAQLSHHSSGRNQRHSRQSLNTEHLERAAGKW